uniref:Uncharacterized protein n=1 Tax=Sphaerodactylus townsendi TaxID=933632 RepID=A0ACB8EKG4_9SAUR
MRRHTKSASQLASSRNPRQVNQKSWYDKSQTGQKSMFPHYRTFLRNLSNNKIKEIREGTFDGAAGVQELMLTGNQLESVNGRMFRGLTGLKTLMLRSNVISCVNNDTFTGLSSVRLLSLYDNRISTITPGAFNTLVSLSTMCTMNFQFSRVLYSGVKSFAPDLKCCNNGATRLRFLTDLST